MRISLQEVAEITVSNPGFKTDVGAICINLKKNPPVPSAFTGFN